MAFHNIRLPDNIERGASGGPSFNTLISTTESGHEVPTARWAYPRQAWNIGYGMEYIDDPTSAVSLVRDFFYAREGRLHSFRFKDWSDYNVPSGVLVGPGAGGPMTFQLFKKYDSGGFSFIRPIYTPVTGTVGVTRIPGGPLSFTVSPTGLVTISTSVQPSENVYAVFEFDNKVRFDTDELNLSLEMFNVGHIPSIPIIEVRT